MNFCPVSVLTKFPNGVRPRCPGPDRRTKLTERKDTVHVLLVHLSHSGPLDSLKQLKCLLSSSEDLSAFVTVIRPLALISVPSQCFDSAKNKILQTGQDLWAEGPKSFIVFQLLFRDYPGCFRLWWGQSIWTTSTLGVDFVWYAIPSS